jgi:hypothetical protein
MTSYECQHSKDLPNSSTRLGEDIQVLPVLILAAQLDVIHIKHLLHLRQCCHVRS